MKVAVYQTNPTLLDVKANLEDVISKIHQGKEKGARLIVFPELALTGYFVGHRYHEAALRLDSKEIQKLVAATKGTAAVVGFIEESPAMNFYNSALVAVDGEILFAYRKLNLPNYGVFEERKYFAPGKWVPVFKLHDLTIAVFICNDVWHPSVPYLGICQKADVFVTILNSAEESMGTEFSNIESWGIISKFYSRVFGIYNILANRVGEESYGDEDAFPQRARRPPRRSPRLFLPLLGRQRDRQSFRPAGGQGGHVRGGRTHGRDLPGSASKEEDHPALPEGRRSLLHPSGTRPDSVRKAQADPRRVVARICTKPSTALATKFRAICGLGDLIETEAPRDSIGQFLPQEFACNLFR